MIKAMGWHEIIETAVKQVGKPVVYVSCGLNFNNDVDDKIWQFICDRLQSAYDTNTYNQLIGAALNSELIFFDSEEEALRFYRVFEEPPIYSSAVYSCIFDSQGKCQTENT